MREKATNILEYISGGWYTNQKQTKKKKLWNGLLQIVFQSITMMQVLRIFFKETYKNHHVGFDIQKSVKKFLQITGMIFKTTVIIQVQMIKQRMTSNIQINSYIF